MFGLSIIKTSELQRLRDVDEFFSKKIGEANEENFKLKEQVKSLTRLRDKTGKFIKK
ncbi:MAG: hypothetical protein LBO74_08690 [Candidatus Symbiothrix sp.]|jgi:hypothetical protein|nr:hypothetical protein [Candidatus Symbiothrix sp.]